MIKELKVENFLSFKGMQEISFEATSEKYFQENLVHEIIHPYSGAVTRLLRLNLIFGANASGKTNLLLAIRSVFQLLFRYADKKEMQLNYAPFGMKDIASTKFEISFFIDNIEYQYAVEYTKNTILKEILRFNPKGVMSLFYTREYDHEKNMPKIIFGENADIKSSVKKTIEENTFNNHTVISTFGKKSFYAPQIEMVYNWTKEFQENISTMQIDISDIASTVVDMLKDNNKRSFMMNYINAADFNIEDIIFEEKEISLPDELRSQIIEDNELSDEQKAKILGSKAVKVNVQHSSDGDSFILPLNLESKGTLKALGLSNVIYKAFSTSGVFTIDEIDDALHFDLLIYVLQLLLVNEHKSQIILSTHNAKLLDEDFIRRDMVWFTYKSSTTASTEVYSAVEFKLHKNVSLYNAYKVGKFGAKPNVGSPFYNISNE